MKAQGDSGGAKGQGAEPSWPQLSLAYPDWVKGLDWTRRFASDAERMGLAVALSEENVRRGTGGPFGAAIFESKSGRLVAVGMNLVVAGRNSTLHAEMVAIQLAEVALSTHRLAGPELPRLELFASCDPCAMCLGATLWSGVPRLVTGASGDDARAIGFDEGPVFEQSWEYLSTRGVEVVRGVERLSARAVLERYAAGGGPIYNGRAPVED
jgi:tRNA(Arg) A34 adenosine deaminase TadA